MLETIDSALVERALRNMSVDERAELGLLLKMDPTVWRPQPAQMKALRSTAYITGYGGAAGGGKSDLVAGLALTQHRRSLILRREKAQTDGIVQRFTEILGTTDGYNSQKSTWRCSDRLIEFGGLDSAGDERKWQGRAHDLKAFDEVTEMREAQVRFVMGWTRTSDADQRARVIMTFNPPTTAEGRWIISFFGPWLDSNHPNPAKPGELRWFTTIKGQDAEVPDDRPFVIFRGAAVYDFDPVEFGPEKIIRPKSRTFVPSRVSDNIYYLRTGYIDTLQSMPEPLRSQMLNGDFSAGVEDDPWQVIPTTWVDEAMARWKPRDAKEPMDSIGADIAAGGKDNLTIARRHGAWFDELIRIPGVEILQERAGPIAAGRIMMVRTDRAPVHADVIGWGLSAVNFLQANDVQTIAVNVANGSSERTVDGKLRFVNRRAEIVWRMRETLDPQNSTPAALPPDPKLRADLAAYKWELKPGGIQIGDKANMKRLLGRSPDDGDAVCLANMATIKDEAWDAIKAERPYDRFAELGV